ncbi:MAG: peptide deformylase, partial [Peptococcaceae bacterium]|nr:peptide deformylase [Peptococcaceae bacterium]
QWVEVIYRDMQWQKRKQRFAGLTAEIIQHEMDHLAGILI